MTSPAAPPTFPVLPGTFGVVRTGGWFGAAIRTLTRSRINHAFIVCGPQQDPGGADIIEMRPRGGAVYGYHSEYPDAIYAMGEPLSTVERAAIVKVAEGLVARHVGYGFPDIAALFLLDTVRWRPKWLLRYVAQNRTMVCSQSVDYCYEQAGVHLFTDGRPPGDVDPGDLETLIASNGWGWSADPGRIDRLAPDGRKMAKHARYRRALLRREIAEHRQAHS